MVSKSLRIANKMGIHMRPANVFVTAMNEYSSAVEIIHNGKTLDGKSIMSIMAAGIKYDDEVTIKCSGSDESEMLLKATEMLKSNLE